MQTAHRRLFQKRLAYESMPPLAIVMTVGYALIILGHYFLLQPGTAQQIMIACAAVSSMASFTIYLRIIRAPNDYAASYLLITILIGILLFNSALHMALFADIKQTTMFAFSMVTAGFFVASQALLAVIVAMHVLVWCAIWINIESVAADDHYLILLLLATIIALLIGYTRMRNLSRLEMARARAQHQLLAVHENHRLYLERILDTLEPGVCVVDAEDTIALCNRAFASFFGSTPEAMTGQALQRAVAGTTFARKVAASPHAAVDVSLLDPPRELSVTQTDFRPPGRRDEQGRLLLAVDVTEARRVAEERELLLTSVHEAQRLESLGVVTGGIAHDFNNLLAIVVGSMEVLKLDNGDNPHINTALSAALRGASMTRQLLAYAGNDTVCPELVDVVAIIEQTLPLLGSCTARQIEFRFAPPGAAMTIDADRLQVQQVIMNIGLNAAEAYGELPGSVELRVARVDAAHVELPRPASGSFIEIVVSDTASGIAKPDMPRLFDPFFSTKGVGRGLGLSACRGIVERHGGRIDIDSEPGAGTTARVLLPASEQRTVAARPAGDATDLAGRSVWVVDDEAELLVIAERFLGEEGATVRSFERATDVRDAIGAVDRMPDIIVIDINMPQLNGLQLGTELQQRYPALPLLIVSGYDQTQIADTLLANAEQIRFLRKPYSREELVAAVRALLR